ncbi:MAG: hypothetical protein KAV87_19520 [Desulfobacteraceae bacterium]|nr:hypothetical protein [Desulfobacteraceae bacterium]
MTIWDLTPGMRLRTEKSWSSSSDVVGSIPMLAGHIRQGRIPPVGADAERCGRCGNLSTDAG